MMRRFWAVLVIAGMAVAVMAAPAAAKKKGHSSKAQAEAVCIAASVAWDGTDNADIRRITVGTPAFVALTKSKDKRLRTAVKALTIDPADDSAVHALGRWCKSHFPKIDQVHDAAFSVPKYHTPTAADFAIGIDVLSKQCFGSAGCNLTYKINVTYKGLTSMDPSKTYTVVYDVAGGDSPITANFTIHGTQITYHNGFTQTPNDAAALTATATSVFEGGS
jgi:hypothetical protein